MCAIKCRSEFDAFDAQLAIESSANFDWQEAPKTIEKTVESMFFVDLNDDAFMPMNILAMVELSDCRLVCGGFTDDVLRMGEEIKLDEKAKNGDRCIAVAGLPQNDTLAVKKYCIPAAQGQGVRSAPTETWFVWNSEEWTSTLVSLHFADTVTGDTLVALRDNHGMSLETGVVSEDIVSVHSRYPFLFPAS